MNLNAMIKKYGIEETEEKLIDAKVKNKFNKLEKTKEFKKERNTKKFKGQ